jgi:hypothetical protein
MKGPELRNHQGLILTAGYGSVMRRSLFAIACAISGIGGFLLALWFMDDAPQSSATSARAPGEQLTIRRVGNPAELLRTTEEIGLILSRSMAGTVDGITRINEREVTMTGWVADPQGDATPQQVLVYVSGALVGKGETNGERSDITSLVGLAFGTEKNVRFALNFACPTGAQPIVVGLGSRKQYISLASPPCP